MSIARPPSTYEGRTISGIPDPAGHLRGLLDRRRHAVRRRRARPAPASSGAELLPVLGQVDRLGRRARGSGRPRARARQPASSGVWPPSWTMTPDRLLGLADGEHVLHGQRLEVQPVARVVVGRDRLRVRVHHHRLVAGLVQRERRVHACVVELDALPDAVRARAQDDDPRPLAGANLASRSRTSSSSRASARRTRRRTCRPSCAPETTPRVAGSRARRASRRAGEQRDATVGDAAPLRRAKVVGRDLPRSSCPAARPRLGIEPRSARRTTGRSTTPRHLLHRVPRGERRLDPQEPVLASPAARAPARARRLVGSAAPASPSAPSVNSGRSSERYALPSASVNVRPIAITSPTRPHHGGQLGVEPGELLERPPRDLHGDVVERRLERRRSVSPVMSLRISSSRVPDREHRRDLRDGEPRRLATPARSSATRAGSSR